MGRGRVIAAIGFLLFGVTACGHALKLEGAPTQPSPPRLTCLASADEVLNRAITAGIVPGGVFVVGRRAGVLHQRAFGRLSKPDAVAVEIDTLYDLASLTKAVATSTLAMALVDQGRLELDAPVSSWLPSFDDAERSRIRVRDLLAHSAGFREWQPFYKEVRDKDALLRRVSQMDLAYEPGTKSVYTDLGPMVLGAVLERVTDMTLDAAARRWVFEPLGMTDTLYRPDASLRERTAPTGESRWRGRFLQGEVHDENAYRMAGVSGHAGLFSTASDLARLAETLLNGGVYRGRRAVRAETVELFTRRVGIAGSSRTLGWETPPGDRWAGRWWSESAFGHTGNTGVMMWVDPKQDLYVILLTNRVLVDGDGEAFGRVRREACEAVLKAIEQGCGA